MSAGTWEYVMGYTTGASTTGGSSGLIGIYTNFFTNSSWNKYYDKYTATLDTAFNNRILGDATGEMGSFSTSVKDPDNISRPRSGWYNDEGYFATASHPWFIRGSSWANGIVAGIFAFYSDTGENANYVTFRVVLTP